MELGELTDLIKTLADKDGPKEIRYGDPTNPKGYHDAMVLRYQPTLGGMQFSYRYVNRIGIEGSGIYSHDPHVIAQVAQKAVETHNRPITNPSIRAMLDSRPKVALSFYIVN